jgi:hypothetical protein
MQFFGQKLRYVERRNRFLEGCFQDLKMAIKTEEIGTVFIR